MDIGQHSGIVLAVIGAALLAFGIGYNHAVAWMERTGYSEGYMSLIVVTGVVATLAGVALVDWHAALLSGAAFALSGLPMIGGSVVRHMRARARAQDAIRREALRR